MQTIPIIPESSTNNLKGKYCLSPFVNTHIDTNGNVSLCPCPAWGDTTVGNVFSQSLDQMLSSPRAQSIRQSIIDGTYQYCYKNKCALIINDALNTRDNIPENVAKQLEDSSLYSWPREIELHGDPTCNLSCPSCRTQIIKLDKDEIVKQEKTADIVFQNIFSQPSDQPIHLITSGSGEVFGSRLLQSLLKKLTLTNFPNLKISLHSNGLLAEKNWHCVEHLEPAIDNITISVDAARPATYEKVRRGGTWLQISNALKFLQNKKQKIKFKFNARMIVQHSNFQEIIEFYQLCKLYNIDRIEYSRLTNWGTWNLSEFKTHDVFDAVHPEKNLALGLINQAKLLPDTWFEGNFN